MDSFDKFHEKVMGAVVAVWIGAAIVSLSVLGFVIWVVIAVLKHFGII